MALRFYSNEKKKAHKKCDAYTPDKEFSQKQNAVAKFYLDFVQQLHQ